jgi:Spy/CpxP family protein refolding chaperone
MRISRIALVLAAMTILAAGSVARAQAPGQTAPGGGATSAQIQKAQAIQKKILQMREGEIKNELNLDGKTAKKLFAILDQYDDQFAKLLAEFRALRIAAQAAANAGDDNKLNDLIDKMVQNQRDRWDTLEARFKDVRKVLTAQQAARLLIVLPQIDQKIRNQIRRALNHPNGGRRRPGAQPPDDDDDDGSDTGDDDVPAQ